MNAVAAIVGSSFSADFPGLELAPEEVHTSAGPVILQRVAGLARPAYLLFRHGLPHRYLPHQIPYRAHALALREVGCAALLVTSSVGVLDASLSLYEPLLLGDLLYLDNRLPDGSTCTLFAEPRPEQGHLVLGEGLVSPGLGAQVRRLAEDAGAPLAAEEVLFAYVGGPRTKTRAENALLARLGAQTNSMTVAPELVLAGELEIACAAVLVGHKYSGPAAPLEGATEVAESLRRARERLATVVRAFLAGAEPSAAGNHLFRFGDA